MLLYQVMAQDYRFISIKVLIDRIMERPIFKDLQLDNAIRWGKWCMEAIDNPEFLTRKIEIIDIESYRGFIPYDMLSCKKVEVIEDTTKNTSTRQSMGASGDPFMKDLVNRNIDSGAKFRTPTYSLEGNYIFTDFEEGRLQIAYDALPSDTSGYLMVPDHSSIIKAIESYIKWRHLEILNDLDIVAYNKVQLEEQNYLWYIAQAQADHFMSNLDTAETMINIQSQLYPDRQQHQNGYKTLGQKEYRRRQ